ncbi:hypothetical protein [Fortiea contorta]|uniref:hypothetical protein n=1 Tax=Fortiea contorta TaxID=1892405 RepID=UPI0003480C98|nr:hypothetical protein [Fortiea contorta]
MNQKVLSIKVAPDDWEWFKEFAKTHRTQADAFQALKEVYQSRQSIPPESLQGAKVYQKCVCVGEKLGLEWLLKESLEQVIKGQKWYVFPHERVVAVKQKSANGSKTWLEVAAEYPREVWEDAQSDTLFTYSPLTILGKSLKSYEDKQAKLNHPTIAEALQKGWVTYKWHWAIEDLVKLAEDYLVLVSQPPEPLGVAEVTEPPKPTELTQDALSARLAPGHVAKQAPKSEKAKANTILDIPAILAKIKPSNMARWTSERDPEGLAWIPSDETRSTWVARVGVAP